MPGEGHLEDPLTEAFVIVCVCAVVLILCTCSIAFMTWCFFEAVHRYFEWSDPMPEEILMTDDEEDEYTRAMVLDSMRWNRDETVLNHGLKHPSDARDIGSTDSGVV